MGLVVEGNADQCSYVVVVVVGMLTLPISHCFDTLSSKAVFTRICVVVSRLNWIPAALVATISAHTHAKMHVCFYAVSLKYLNV